MMEKCGVNVDRWNAFETQIKANKELIRALIVRPNSLTTKEHDAEIVA
jgi:ribosomal protein S6